jgi:hypothetical protein
MGETPRPRRPDAAGPGHPASSPPRVVGVALLVAAAAGLVHAASSAYWGLGGDWLVETLGERIVTTFADVRWLLLVVAAVKVAGALVPLWLARRGLLRRMPWVALLWLAVAVLVLWGGANTVVGNLVLAGVVTPDGGYDRPAMVGHAWLWDPLFLLWGLALAVALRRAPRPR